MFPELEESMHSRFMYVGQVEMSLKEDDHVLMVFASLSVRKSNIVASDMLVVSEFLDVFSEDICDDLPLKHEVKFVIDLVPDTRSNTHIFN